MKSTYKKLALSILFFITFVCSFHAVSFAHVLETNGDVGAVLHIDPDDEPLAGKPSNFFLEFKDKSGKFDPKDCVCTVTITKNGETIFSENLFQESDSGVFAFTFPEKNIYMLQVTGAPTDKNSFQPFTLSYDIRVDKEAQVTQDASLEDSTPIAFVRAHLFPLLFGVGIILFGGILLALKLKKKRS